VTADRVTEARIVGAADDERITALSTRDNSLVLRHRPRTPGQKIVAVAVGWRLVIGHPLEFMPLADPGAARVSSELRMRLVFQGKPLAGARVHAGVAPTAGKATPPDRTLVTSDDGIVTVPVGVAGLWNVRTIHVVPSPTGADANWDVHWATFVYAVK